MDKSLKSYNCNLYASAAQNMSELHLKETTLDLSLDDVTAVKTSVTRVCTNFKLILHHWAHPGSSEKQTCTLESQSQCSSLAQDELCDTAHIWQARERVKPKILIGNSLMTYIYRFNFKINSHIDI